MADEKADMPQALGERVAKLEGALALSHKELHDLRREMQELFLETYKTKRELRLEQLGHVPGSLARIIGRLAKEAGMPPAEVIRRGVALFKLAFDADMDGNRLAVLDAEDTVVRDIPPVLSGGSTAG